MRLNQSPLPKFPELLPLGLRKPCFLFAEIPIFVAYRKNQF